MLSAIEAGIAQWVRQFYKFNELEDAVVSLKSVKTRQDWLRQVRLASFWSLKRVGKRIGVSTSAYRKIENSEIAGIITLNRLRECAKALDCELVYGLRPINRKPVYRRITDAIESRIGRCPPKAVASRIRDLTFDPRLRRELGWSKNTETESQELATLLSRIRCQTANTTSIRWPTD